MFIKKKNSFGKQKRKIMGNFCISLNNKLIKRKLRKINLPPCNVVRNHSHI